MNHKIAILSDIHGNATALEAVIADAKNQGASEYWLLGDIFLPGPGANDLVALLKDLPITTSVRGNWDDRVLEALDGEYGLEHPKEIQSMRMTQFLMDQMDPATIVWLRSLPLLEKKEIDGLRFSISHNLPNKNYGGDLLVENDTEKFDNSSMRKRTWQSMVMFTSSCFVMAVKGNKSSIQGRLACPILIGRR